MGYYTSYDATENPPEVVERIMELSEYRDWYDGGEISDIKWYSHDTDMLQVSTEFPDLILTLYGDGEESGDIWKSYYKNGKMHTSKVVISFEDFDESKLK